MTDLVKIKNPPRRLNLAGRATLAITIKEPMSKKFHLEIAVVMPGIGRQRMARRVMSSKKCDGEAEVWMAIRDLAENKLTDLAEIEIAETMPSVTLVP